MANDVPTCCQLKGALLQMIEGFSASDQLSALCCAAADHIVSLYTNEDGVVNQDLVVQQYQLFGESMQSKLMEHMNGSANQG